MSYFDDNLPKMVSTLDEVESLPRRLESIQNVRDDWFNPVLREEIRGIDQILVRSHAGP